MTQPPVPRPIDHRRRWLTGLPKAELHLHLDGSLRPATALELARAQGRRLDGDIPSLEAMAARLVAPAHCADQAELLRAFDLPVSLLQDAASLERVSGELVEDVAAEGTRYAEIRWAPSLHRERGLRLDDGIGAVARGARVAADSAGITVRLIAVALRTHDTDVALEVARAAAGAMADGVTGFDLAGREAEAPDVLRFGRAFELARAAGLGISCHAGEWGGVGQVRAALAVAPWRIAHGAPAIDDPTLVEELIRDDVTLDLCPTSSVQAGAVPDLGAHPLPCLLRAGVPVTISTDDRTVSDLTLVEELTRSMVVLGLTPGEVLAVIRQGYRAAFLHHDEPLRARLMADLDAWAAIHPAPEGDAA